MMILESQCTRFHFKGFGSLIGSVYYNTLVDLNGGCEFEQHRPRVCRRRLYHAGPLNRAEFTPNLGGLLNLNPFPGNIFLSPIHDKSIWTVNATNFGSGIVETGDFGEPISLGTMKLPSNVDVKRVEGFLFQSASTQVKS